MVKDYFLFKRMLIPFLVQIIFWLGVLAVIVTGIIDLMHGLWFFGILTIILGPLVVRLACEYIVVLFEINDTLTDIKEFLTARIHSNPTPPPPPSPAVTTVYTNQAPPPPL